MHTRDMITAALAPHQDESDRSDLLYTLFEQMRPMLPDQPIQPLAEEQKVEVIRYDPQAAAEWFRQQGYVVIEGEISHGTNGSDGS